MPFYDIQVSDTDIKSHGKYKSLSDIELSKKQMRGYITL